MIIKGFSQSSAYNYGDIMAAQYKLRYKIFAQRQSYDVPIYNEMEYDSYDTPATVYFTWQDDNNETLGVSRVKPTDRSYMIEDLWPDLITSMEMPKSIKVWESSRFGVEKSVDAATKKQVIGALVCANLEFGLLNGIDYYIGIMHPRIWKRTFVDSGWEVEFLGDPKIIDGGDRVVAAKMPVSFKHLVNVKNTMGFDGPVLQMPNQKLLDINISEAA